MQPIKDLKAQTIIAKAFYRAADTLELSRQEISKIAGPSEATISRNIKALEKKEPVVFDPKTAECALMVLRIYRSLLALVGDSQPNARKWLNTENRYFGETPRRRIQTLGGLIEVANYLDAMRGKV